MFPTFMTLIVLILGLLGVSQAAAIPVPNHDGDLIVPRSYLLSRGLKNDEVGNVNHTAYIFGTESDADTAAKRSIGPETTYKNGILTIKMTQPPSTKEEFNAIVADAIKQQGQDVDDLPSADALVTKAKLVKRSDPCDQADPDFDSQPIFSCNKHPLDRGACPLQGVNTDCAAWCEVSRRFFYGMEQPYSAEIITIGNGAPTHSLTEGFSVSWGLSFDIGLGLADPEGVLSGALGFSLSKTVTYSLTQSFQADPDKMNGYCGYFTFIPKMVESCGTLTQYEYVTIGDVRSVTTDRCSHLPLGTTENVCITHPFKNEDGKTDGVTVVALTLCDNEHLLAPMKFQHKTYQLPGVADISPHTHEQG
ncbi:hypothetical protein ABW21_db0203012 [Orbilia brochopaga]|nr:hypothetical protein ABW21_db0203012 [Drechslerella brochopaga]